MNIINTKHDDYILRAFIYILVEKCEIRWPEKDSSLTECVNTFTVLKLNVL